MVNSNHIDTPESAPSVAAISQASSTDSDDIVRALFCEEKPSSIQLGVVENIQTVTKSPNGTPSSGVSITSSDATVVASWNLSPDLLGTSSECEPTEAYQFFEDPPEDHPRSCNGLSLTQKQLADLFLVFEGAGKLWPTRNIEKVEKVNAPQPDLPDSDGGVPSVPQSTGVEWRRRAESLERECRALKKIARIDSTNIVKLKRTVETQRETRAHKDAELYKKQMVIGILGHQVEAMKKDADIRREREAELLETIRILKEEVDQLTNSEESSRVMKQKEVEGTKGDCFQHFAMQNDESHRDTVELRGLLAAKVAENRRLRSEIESLREELNRKQNVDRKELVYNFDSTGDNQVKSDESLSTEDTPSSPAPPPDDLVEVLRQISARLEVVERGQDREEELIREERQSREDGMEGLRLMVEESCKRREEILQITQDPDEVEVLLPRQNARKTRSKTTKDMPVKRDAMLPYIKEDELQSWCCNSWVPI